MTEETTQKLQNQKHVEANGNTKMKALSLKLNSIASVVAQESLGVISVFWWIWMILWMELTCIVLMLVLFFKGGVVGKLICIVYATYWYFDRDSPENNYRGQGSEYFRTLTWLKYFTNFFPVKLVKTVDLPADKNYLFAVFPHGMISIGAFCNFATSLTNFRELFPGIRSKLCTLHYHFQAPFYRELILSWGLISCSAKSIINALTQSNNKLAVCNYDGYTSNAVALIVGGAQEALHARPGNYRIVLKNRKGFVKLAIQTGSPIVPVISFGEIDVYDQPANEPGSYLRAYQDFVKKWTGVTPAVFLGRGFLENSFGFLPYNRPITTVIGAPIEVTENPTPSREEVNAIHEKFVEEIGKLFEDHKHKYIKNAENIQMILE